MNDKSRNLLNHPIKFILRQIYKLLVVWPFQLVAFIYSGLAYSSVPGKESASIVFLITSSIYSKAEKKVSYGGPRTIFSPEERAQQTLQTIDSIRKMVPEAKIVLMENGLKKELPFGLPEKTDQYIYLGDKKMVRFAADNKNKSLGEAVMILSGLKKINWKAERYFKISGRYYLTGEFNLNGWGDRLTFGKLKEDYFITRLYGFPQKLFPTWRTALLRGLPLNLIDYAIEHTLFKYLPSDETAFIEKLGVSGLAASVPGNLLMQD